ncbi:MAG: HPr family phosphocarrier protein [Gammaproteobacteria bacterium]
MIKTDITINNRTGLHARAAAKLVETTTSFDSSVEISNGEKTVDGKSILSVMLLAASPGSELKLLVDGNDENEAILAITQLVEKNFGEDEEE